MKRERAMIESDGSDLFVVFDGKRIARRGRPGTPQARTWVSLEPGYSVFSDEKSIVVEHVGIRVH
jgi:hypothetical protein